MDLDKTLTSEARIVLFAVSKQKTLRVLRCPLFITEARVRWGKQYLVRRRKARIGQERSNDNNQDKAGKMSLFSRKVFNVLDHIMHPRYGGGITCYLLFAECSWSRMEAAITGISRRRADCSRHAPIPTSQQPRTIPWPRYRDKVTFAVLFTTKDYNQACISAMSTRASNEPSRKLKFYNHGEG